MKTLHPPGILRQSWGNAVFSLSIQPLRPAFSGMLINEKNEVQSNIALTTILEFYTFVLFLGFFYMFCHNLLIPKALDKYSNSCKTNSPQNTPKTVPERPSRLIISVTFDDFYRINQTFWCSTVGVSLIEIHTKVNFLKLFSKRYCIDSTFIFRKVS